MKTTPKTLAKKAAAYVRTKDRARALYAKADRLLDELAAAAPVGTVFALPDGKQAQLVDAFADRNLVYGHGGVRRIDLKLLKEAA